VTESRAPQSLHPAAQTTVSDTQSPHSLTAEELYASLQSSPQGLTREQTAQRFTEYGPNEISEVAGVPMWRKFASNFYHLFAIMLWIGGGLAFVGGMRELGWAIFAVILINAIFSFWQEFRAEKATEALKHLIPQKARVMRDGEVCEILAPGVVPGDLLLLEEGDNISADARLVEEFDLRVNQATLNGESTPARRNSRPFTAEYSNPTELPNMVFAGTAVAYGRGKAIVTATGMHTQFGTIAGLTQSVVEELSPLQKEMEKVTQLVAMLATGLGISFFLLGYFVGGLTLIEGFLFSVGIIVANVPEGLLPTVTLALAMGVQRMAGHHALVKRLSAVETLGSTTVICTDKTGTLTANEMTVRELYVPGATLEITGTGYDPTGSLEQKGSVPSKEISRLTGELLALGGLCTDARLMEPDDDHPAWHIVGDPTEAAILVAAAKIGRSRESEEASAPRVYQLPFDATRKRMSTVHQTKERSFASVKGAPREMLDLCTTLITAQGTRDITEADRTAAMDANDEFARSGLRVLAVATRTVPHANRYEIEDVERDLTFVGLVAMMDPPRPAVARTVELCHTAGIRIIMITGDYGLTAESIARRIGIVSGDTSRIVTGAELEQTTDTALHDLLGKETELLFARVSPEHKMRVAQALKSLGHVVAMTGDGVNDAPALKTADIGIAMGQAGTDVAREAADMVLTDDNFASIVHAVEEGRAVFDNIRRFVTYIFTSNIPEIVPFILFVLFGIPLPLTILQILAIDLGTDLVPALALGIERPEPGVMSRQPRKQSERLLNKKVLVRAYFFLGPIQTAACMLAYFWAYWSRGWQPGTPLPASGHPYMLATTMTFAAVVATQIGNGFAQRTTRESIFTVGIFTNRLLLVGIVSEVALLALLVYWAPLAGVFGFVPIEARDWLLLAALSPTLLVADECRKYIVRRMYPAAHDGNIPTGQHTPSRNEEAA